MVTPEVMIAVANAVTEQKKSAIESVNVALESAQGLYDMLQTEKVPSGKEISAAYQKMAGMKKALSTLSKAHKAHSALTKANS
jgi:hypothetical protein